MIDLPHSLRWLAQVIRYNYLPRLYLPDDLYDLLEDAVAKLQQEYPSALIHFIDTAAYEDGFQNFMWKGIAVCSYTNLRHTEPSTK